VSLDAVVNPAILARVILAGFAVPQDHFYSHSSSFDDSSETSRWMHHFF
jgi:hypothetical protein